MSDDVVCDLTASPPTQGVTPPTEQSRNAVKRKASLFRNPDISRRQTLRIPASSVAMVTGLHTFSDRLVDRFIDHLYQDMFDELVHDCEVCGLQLVSQEQQIQDLIEQIGGAEAAALKKVRAEAADGKKVDTTKHVAALHEKVTKATRSAASKQNLAPEQRMLLQREMSYHINTNFGTRNEHVAIVEYEKRTGLKVEGNNDTRYEMLFPTPKGFWKFVAKPEVRCRGVPLKGLQLLKASQLHADADNVDNNKALGRVSNCAIKEPSTATSADSCGVDPTDSPDSEFSDVELDIESVEEALTSVDTANFASDSAIDDDSIVAILSSDSEDDTMPPEQNGLLEFMEHLTKTFGSRQIGPTEAEKSCTGCAGDGSGCCRLIATNVSRHQRKFLHRVATDLSLGHGTIRQRREPNSASMATAFWVWDQRAQLQVINSMKPADGSQQDAATTSVAPYCSFLRNVLETIFGSSCQEHASKRRNRERSVGVKSLNLGDNTWRIDPTNASKQDAHSASKWRQPRPLFKICGMVDGLTIDTISISSASASTAKRRATLSVEQKQRIARSRQKAMRKRQQLSRAASKSTRAPHMPSAISTMYPSVFHHLNFKLRLKNPPSTQGGQTQIEPRRKTEDLPLDNVDPRSRVVVEIKNRMTSIKQPPPFYDQVQSVVYMLMLKCIHADLVQYLKVGKQEQPAGAGEPIRGEQQPPDNPPLTLAVDRINLHGAPHYHSRNWDNEVVPRLYQYVATVEKFRRHRDLRLAFLSSDVEQQRAVLAHECPFLGR